MNNFQTILIAVFLAFFVFAVLMFSGIINLGNNSSKTGPTGKVVIWGTFDSSELGKVFDDLNQGNKNLDISYVKKNESTYENDLIQAFAKDSGPDLFFMTPSMIQKFSGFVYEIPYASYPQKTFSDSFVDGADIYLDTDGSIGFPVVVDPLVLYYNKDILSNAGIATPPTTWDQLFNLNSTLTKQDQSGTITSSMIALGRYDNVANAKDILATLLFQNGNTIMKKTDKGYDSVLKGDTNTVASPAETVLSYFVEFSNPSKSAYSWNMSLPISTDMFTGGKMAFYLGKASELFNIESVNPNLSFDVTQVPQTKGSNISRTFGDIYAISVNKKSTNLTSALNVSALLSTSDNAKNFATALSLPPALKSLLADKPTDPYLFTFFNSALISRGWADPDTLGSDKVFSELINNILSNKFDVSSSVSRASDQLQLLIK